MFVLLLLPQVNYFIAKDSLVVIDYLATENYLIVLEDIVALSNSWFFKPFQIITHLRKIR
jgi:hypothetical protein